MSDSTSQTKIMENELDVLKDVCQKLDSANVAYMLTGSFASNFYAIPRMTRDIDIVIEIQMKDINKIVKIFQNDFYIERNDICEAVQNANMFNIIHNGLSLKIDFIIRKEHEYRLVEFQRKKRILIDDTPIWIVSPEDLIISKLDWGKESFSEMQIKDVKNLLSSVQNIDIDYMVDWIHKLNLTQIYDKVKQRE